MIPIVWKEYTCTLSGSACKFVECEQCQQKYVYRMTRAVQGKGSSLYFLDNPGAQGRAQDSASSALQLALAEDCDPVPCPKCGRYQPDMVQKLRRYHKAWIYWTGLGLLFPFVICTMIAWVMYWTPQANPVAANWLLGVAAGILATAVGMIFLRRRLGRRLQPNDAAQSDRLRIAESRAESVNDFAEWLSRQTPDPGEPDRTTDIRTAANPRPAEASFTRKMTIDGIALDKIYVFAKEHEATLDEMLMVIRDPRLAIAGGDNSRFNASTEVWYTLPGEDESAALQRIAREVADRHPGKAVLVLAWPGTYPTVVAALVTETEYQCPFAATSTTVAACNTAI